MKKIISLACAFLLALTFVGTLAGCNYKKDYTYKPINRGTLREPEVEFKTAAEDPEQNAKFREKYPTLKKYEQPVKVTVGAIQYQLESDVKPGTTPMNQSFNKIARDVLNIEIEYTVVSVSTGYDQKLNLAISANQMPDMFYTTQPEMFTMLRDTKMLADLTDSLYMLNDNLLENYLTYMPELLEACMEDSKLYALPQQSNKYASAQRLYIRKDWLDIVGMQAPTTIDEMIAVGEAFANPENKAKIAEKTGVAASKLVPLSMHKDITYAGSYSAEGMFNAHGASVGSYFKGEDGKLYSSNTSPEARAAIETMRTMYGKGILDNEFSNITSADVQSYVSAGQIGMVFGEWWLPKDALGTCVKSYGAKGADWTWVDLPSYKGNESLPIVDTTLISGYNLVSKNCRNPEAVAKLINLFYDIYYNDNAEQMYGSGVLPSNGFYYQFVPVKVWDGMASAAEYHRVQTVFNELYEGGLNSRELLSGGLSEDLTNAQIAEYEAGGGRLYKISASEKGFYCLNRQVVEKINSEPALKEAFDTMRNREKILHFAQGYPYFVAYKQGVSIDKMTTAEREGWGIYHEMIDENGSYAYVVDLSEGKKKAKYDEFYGVALSAMTDKGGYLADQTGIYYARIITGTSGMSAFDEFISVYNRNGGDVILKQVNEWYAAEHAND